jgi:DNA primase
MDRNPSFSVKPGSKRWTCFGCGESGDAVALVRRLNPSMTLPEAVAFLTRDPTPSGECPTPRQRPRERPPADVPPRSEGMPEADALALVADAERRLWAPERADALAYLHGRGMTDEAIRAARLGWWWVRLAK